MSGENPPTRRTGTQKVAPEQAPQGGSADAEQSLTPDEVRRWTRVGTLAACSLLLSYAETFVPIPIPGVKLGLANVAVLAELACADARGAACIALIKVLASGLLFGSPLTMAYSAVGTLLALGAMVPLSRLRTMRLWMVSVAGALLHEIGQLCVAQIVLRTQAVWYTLPLLMVAGCVTGAICGWLAEALYGALPSQADYPTFALDPARLLPKAPNARTTAACLALVGFSVVTLHLQSVAGVAACLVAALVVCVVLRVPAPSLARPLVPLVATGALVCVLQLWAMGANFETALRAALVAGLGLAALLYASTAFARAVDASYLTGIVAWLAAPLARAGVLTTGFVLAFDVAVRLVPALADIVQEERGTSDRLSLRDLRERLPVIVKKVMLRAASL